MLTLQANYYKPHKPHLQSVQSSQAPERVFLKNHTGSLTLSSSTSSRTHFCSLQMLVSIEIDVALDWLQLERVPVLKFAQWSITGMISNKPALMLAAQLQLWAKPWQVCCLIACRDSGKWINFIRPKQWAYLFSPSIQWLGCSLTGSRWGRRLCPDQTTADHSTGDQEPRKSSRKKRIFRKYFVHSKQPTCRLYKYQCQNPQNLN